MVQLSEDQAALILRSANWIGWIVLVALVLWSDRPVPRAARQIISLVLVFGMTVFEIGGLVPFGFPLATSRMIATIFCGFALAGVTVILLAAPPGGGLPGDDDSADPGDA